MQLLALNHSLLRHGDGMVFSGLLLAGLAFSSTRRGWRTMSSGFLIGRARVDFYLRWPLLAVGIAGLLLMLVAVVT